ncbi:MAG: glutamate--tRNA ligase [Candidatus Paceibacterota bacterium]
MKNKIITRFPPSPTGWFHIGNARTALFNYFFTKKNGGVLKFRLEDTDKERSKQEYADDIIAGLKWLGIDIDYSDPYKQSEHGQTYQKYLEKMIADNMAYISKEEVKEEGQRSEVIRLRNPNKKVIYNDLVRGEIEVDTTELGDFVIAKSLNEPLYHLAVVIDDFEMEITHIIRGEDGIYNTPRQILIQEAIGAPRPIYAHMPFILNEDRSKLSKRKQGELVSLKFYRDNGYLPEAMVNFLSLCGWNPGTDQEILSMEELIEKFDITKVQKSGAVFNKEKLLWMNKEYLKRLDKKILKDKVSEILKSKYQFTENILEKTLPTIVERINTFGELEKYVTEGEFDYFFLAPEPKKEMLIWKKDTDFAIPKNNLTKVLEILGKIAESDFTEEKLKATLITFAEANGKGSVLWPLRVALSGKEKSPDPFTLLTILGQTESLTRITKAISIF